MTYTKSQDNTFPTDMTTRLSESERDEQYIKMLENLEEAQENLE